MRERGDRHLLQPPHVLMHVVAVGPQRDDRVGDQLARPVVGDAAAPVGVADLDPLHLVPLDSHRQLGRRRAAAAGIDRLVLEQQQDVRELFALPGGLEATLYRSSLLVGNQSTSGYQDFGAHP